MHREQRTNATECLAKRDAIQREQEYLREVLLQCNFLSVEEIGLVDSFYEKKIQALTEAVRD